jgi:formate dehydrogenase iron-sulfur subunit
METAYLYGAADEPGEQIAGELGAFFLLTEPPERFGLPAKADSPIQENAPAATAAGLTAAAVAIAVTAVSFLASHRRRG